MAASQKATWEAPSFAELPKLVSPTTNRICVRTRSRSPSSRLSPVGPLEGIAHYSGGGAFALRGIQVHLRSRGKPGVQVAFGLRLAGGVNWSRFRFYWATFRRNLACKQYLRSSVVVLVLCP